MSYEVKTMKEALFGNPYVGRGIVIGKSEDGKKAVFAYFIMGRSENSRNRVFVRQGDGEITIYPFDESKVKDPSLIIYSPVRRVGDKVIVTNGDQTDTIAAALEAGKCFRHALKSRTFEPDAPNFTPRISGIFSRDGAGYSLSILKSADEKGSACNRYTFDYEPLAGLGHFIHTYETDGDPLPTFTGEPERVFIPDDIEAFANEIWDNLDEDNRISLYCGAYEIGSDVRQDYLINRYSKEVNA